MYMVFVLPQLYKAEIHPEAIPLTKPTTITENIWIWKGNEIINYNCHHSKGLNHTENMKESECFLFLPAWLG